MRACEATTPRQLAHGIATYIVDTCLRNVATPDYNALMSWNISFFSRSLLFPQREKRLKPLNDLFSMAECSLLADTVEYFVANDIPFDPPSVVSDVLECIGTTHTSGDFHRIVAENPELYFEPTPRMKEVRVCEEKSDRSAENTTFPHHV